MRRFSMTRILMYILWPLLILLWIMRTLDFPYQSLTCLSWKQYPERVQILLQRRWNRIVHLTSAMENQERCLSTQDYNSSSNIPRSYPSGAQGASERIPTYSITLSSGQSCRRGYSSCDAVAFALHKSGHLCCSFLDILKACIRLR